MLAKIWFKHVFLFLRYGDVVQVARKEIGKSTDARKG